MPHFSVIMPLYNKAPYVQKAVESVVGQSFSDWELIVVDDGSNDGSGAVVEGINDSRIHLIRQNNGGVSAARNRGVTESRAEWICFLDADDWWEPTFLEEMEGMIARHSNAGIYGTGYWIVKNGEKRVAPIGVDEGFSEGEINYCRVYAKTLCMPLTSISVAMPKKVFAEIGGFPSGIKLGEDFMLWIHVALNHKVVLLNKPLANYNQDVDIAFRGTHHLHPPEHNMLWNLNDLEPLEQNHPDYKQLVDNLRVYGLRGYLLDNRYRSNARQELSKVDWSRQPMKIKRIYSLPIPILKLWTHILIMGSNIKQTILKHV